MQTYTFQGNKVNKSGTINFPFVSQCVKSRTLMNKKKVVEKQTKQKQRESEVACEKNI